MIFAKDHAQSFEVKSCWSQRSEEKRSSVSRQIRNAESTTTSMKEPLLHKKFRVDQLKETKDIEEKMKNKV